MKKILFVLLVVGFVQQLPAQLTAQYIGPSVIDSNYSTSDDSNYVVIDPSMPSLNRLLLFLPGTGAKTKHYTLFPQLAAELGYHCISLAYANGYPTVAMSCAGNADTNCYRDIRQEVCYGTDVSTHETVDTFNSVYTRLVKILEYLDAHYPSQNWGQFLNAGAPVWNRIAVSGHSQGGGHALYLAKTQTCERMIMFAGADDYSNYYSSAANWTFGPGLTPVTKFYSFLHLYDDVWDYSKQYAVVQATGMTVNDDSTLVDNASGPYSNSHCLYTTLTPLHAGIYSAYHNGMVVDYYTPLDGSDQPVYLPVWTYMLTSAATGIADQGTANEHVKLFPNPAANTAVILLPNNSFAQELDVYTTLGHCAYTKGCNKEAVVSFDVSALQEGAYIVAVRTANGEVYNQRLLIRR